MSIEKAIRYNQTKQFLKRVDDLKAKGEEFIQKIGTSLTQLYPGHFKQSKGTPTRLDLEFYGLPLFVRVEVEIEEDELGRVRTYLCDDSTPPRPKKLEFEYIFDDLGNVNRTMTIGEAAAAFGPDLIDHLRSKKIALLP